MERSELSPQRLAWMARCERRLWLDRQGDPERKQALDAEAMARAEQRARHRDTITVALAAQAVPPGSPEQQVAATLRLMHAGVAAIRGGVLACDLGDGLLLRGPIDLLLRQEEPSTLGEWSYQPVAIMLHHAPRREDWLLLDAFRQLVAARQGLLPTGALWLGRQDAMPEQRLYAAETLTRFEQTWQRLNGLVEQSTAPAIWFERSCRFCPWRTDCEQRALATQDLALLPQLSADLAAKLCARQITTIPALAALDPGQLQGIGRLNAQRTSALLRRAQALSTGKALPLRPGSPANQEAPALFFDVEASPDEQQPWAFGWRDAQGRCSIALIADAAALPTTFQLDQARFLVVASLAAAWNAFEAAAGTDAVLVHWGDYEHTLLGTAADAQRRRLRPRLRDAHRLLTSSYALPIPRTPTQQSGSLKAVGAWRGVRWPEQGRHWRAAYDAFFSWQRKPDDAHRLLPVLAYLGSDLEALARAWAWMNATHEE